MLIYSLTTSAKIVLLLVAVTFIVFALVTSMWIPRRKPDFPGNKKLPVFLVLTAALFVAQLGAVVWATGQEAEAHGGEEAAHVETEPEETTPAETETEPAETAPTETETTPTETETTETETTETETETTETEPTETEPAEPAGDAEAGKAVYTAAGCGGCHVLADAGSAGTVGPDLDESQPSYDLVVDRVTNGAGAMPAFGNQLSEQEIADVSEYVSSVAGT